MSHPDPRAPADRRPIERGEVLENPVTRERAIALELPWENAQGSVVAELTALPGAHVAGEHLHPSLHERFTVIEGELTVVCDAGGRRCTPGRAPTSSPGRGTTGGTRPRPTPLALTAQEFSDIIVFRKPPPRVQRVVFAALAPIARRRGYRATYASLSRTTLAPR